MHGCRVEFARDGDCFVDSSGSAFRTRAAAVHSLFPFLCGCGEPASNHGLLRRVLECFQKGGGRSEEVVRIVRSEPALAAAVIVDVLNHFELLEHGSNAELSWPTPRGEQIIEHGDVSEDDLGW